PRSALSIRSVQPLIWGTGLREPNLAALHLPLPHGLYPSSYSPSCARLSSFLAWPSGRPSLCLVSCRVRRLSRHSWFRVPRLSCPASHCFPGLWWIRSNREPAHTSAPPLEELLETAISFSYKGGFQLGPSSWL